MMIYAMACCLFTCGCNTGCMKSDGYHIDTERQAGRYPYNKVMRYSLVRDGNDCDCSVYANYKDSRLMSLYVGDGFMNAKREEANETIAIGKSMKNVELAKTDYQVKMQFFRKVINDLAQKEDMSHFKQIITRAEIWGDASVELSQSYCQHNNGTKKSTDSIVSNSRLVNDIRMILSQYGMHVISVECDNVYPISRSEFLKGYNISSSNVPDYIFRSDVFIEIE